CSFSLLLTVQLCQNRSNWCYTDKHINWNSAYFPKNFVPWKILRKGRVNHICLSN
ncbi:hypothetical protein X975_25784, partial [Stegodyphus mimosarum]